MFCWFSQNQLGESPWLPIAICFVGFLKTKWVKVPWPSHGSRAERYEVNANVFPTVFTLPAREDWWLEGLSNCD